MGSMSREAECESKVRQGDECVVCEPRAEAMAERRELRGLFCAAEASQPYKALVRTLVRIALAIVCESSGSHLSFLAVAVASRIR